VPSDVKADPSPILKAHWQSLRHANTGRPYWPDYALFFGPSAAVLALALIQDFNLTDAAGAALLTISGLLSAFLFGATLQIYEHAYTLEHAGREPGEALSTQATNILELAANAAYAALVCILAAVAFAVTSLTGGEMSEVATAVGLALTMHYALILVMVMRRLFLRTQVSLERARTGADVPRERRRRRPAA
jgi:hypothetical protein